MRKQYQTVSNEEFISLVIDPQKIARTHIKGKIGLVHDGYFYPSSTGLVWTNKTPLTVQTFNK